jgi:class 3 adenylate cyclase
MACRTVRIQIGRFGGQEVNTVGDGVVATFSNASQANTCGMSLIRALKSANIELRAGIHTGEVELRRGG